MFATEGATVEGVMGATVVTGATGITGVINGCDSGIVPGFMVTGVGTITAFAMVAEAGETVGVITGLSVAITGAGCVANNLEIGT